MSEPGGGVTGVRTRRRSYKYQNQEERLLMSEPSEGVIGVRTRRRSYRCQNQVKEL